MLKTPAFQYYDDLRITIYQDDTQFWKFYMLPDRVQLRNDQNGKPVFQLLKYAFSDEARQNDPQLPSGGGIMMMDVELRVAENERGVLRSRLQAYVDREWNRLKAAAEAAGTTVQTMALPTWDYRTGGVTNGVPQPINDPAIPGDITGDFLLGLDPDRPTAPPGDEPPQVQLSYPEWTDGTFHVTVPSSDTLVSNAVTEGPLSLTGANNAAIMVELTQSGATLMERALTNRDGSGAADVLPISLRMDLKFMARIPPVKLSIRADSRAVFQAMESIEHDFDERGCNTDDIAHYETKLDAAIESKLIDVRFDTGMLKADDDLIQEIRGTALDIVESLITEELFDKEEPPADPDATTGNDLINADKDYFILKQEAAIEFKTITYNETMTSIIEAEKHPQATLQGFFAGLSAQEMQQFIRVIDLSDSFFEDFELTVNCYANWENTPIAAVEVQVKHFGRNEQGVNETKEFTFTFNETETSKTLENVSRIGNSSHYSWRWRVIYDGRPPEDFSRWQNDTMPVINLAVPDSGRVDLRVLAGNIDFTQIVDQVQVDLRYSDPGSGVQEIGETFKLTAAEQDFRFTRDIFAERDRPVDWSARFFLKTGQVVEVENGEEMTGTLVVNSPRFDTLNVKLMPVGQGWQNVEQVIVDLRYEDPANDYFIDQSMRLASLAEFKDWAVYLQDINARKFSYKVMTSFKDGRFTETDFMEEESDQTLDVQVQEQPTLAVKIMPNLVDFAATPVVTCTLRYEDPANGITDIDTFAFDASNMGLTDWQVLLSEDSPRSYSRSVTYHTFHGAITTDAEVTEEQVFTLPRIAVPEVKCTFDLGLVDFIDTPLVEMQVVYADPVNGRDTTETFLIRSAGERPVFQHPVDPTSPRAFDLTVIYHRAGGTREARDPVSVDAKQWVISPRVTITPAPVPEPVPDPVG